MSSLYDGLSEKLKKDPRLTKGGVARYALTLLLFNARESLRVPHAAWRHAPGRKLVRDRYNGAGRQTS